MTDEEILDVIKRRMVFELAPVRYPIWGIKAIRLVVSWRKDNNELETIYESEDIETESSHRCDSEDNDY